MSDFAWLMVASVLVCAMLVYGVYAYSNRDIEMAKAGLQQCVANNSSTNVIWKKTCD